MRGKHFDAHSSADTGGAHPRVCGENRSRSNSSSHGYGSSPRVRGKQHPFTNVRFNRGLIPACAGKTRRCPAASWRTQAHPRVCGENHAPSNTGSVAVGSSPRVRGKPGDGVPRFGVLGLIPACAGKTCTQSPTVTVSPAHPRVCGENSPANRVKRTSCGSSPRVRGKL